MFLFLCTVSPSDKEKRDQEPTSPPSRSLSSYNGSVVIAKQPYVANPDSLIGTELSLQQGEMVTLVYNSPNTQLQGSIVRNAKGEEGFVPTVCLDPVPTTSGGSRQRHPAGGQPGCGQSGGSQ